MPAKPEWLLRLPDIRAHLEYVDTPVVDRAVIERIFGLKRRRAIGLMHEFGGYQAGRTFLLDRVRLLEVLRSLESREDYTIQKWRRERLRMPGGVAGAPDLDTGPDSCARRGGATEPSPSRVPAHAVAPRPMPQVMHVESLRPHQRQIIGSRTAMFRQNPGGRR